MSEGSWLKVNLEALDKIPEVAKDVKIVRELLENENPRVLDKKIYTHDTATKILEMFEDLLDKHNIIIPDEDREDLEDDEDGAALYGTTYSELLDNVESQIIDELKKVLPEKCFSDGNEDATENTRVITGIYSGEI